MPTLAQLERSRINRLEKIDFIRESLLMHSEYRMRQKIYQSKAQDASNITRYWEHLETKFWCVLCPLYAIYALIEVAFSFEVPRFVGGSLG